MTRIKYRLQSGKLRRGLVPRPIQFLLSLSLYRGFIFPRRPHCTGSIVVGLAQVRNWDAHVELREAPSSVAGCWLAGKRTHSNTQGERIRWGSLAATYGATTTATGKMGQCRESGAVGMARLQSAMRRDVLSVVAMDFVVGVLCWGWRCGWMECARSHCRAPILCNGQVRWLDGGGAYIMGFYWVIDLILMGRLERCVLIGNGERRGFFFERVRYSETQLVGLCLASFRP